MGNGMPNSHSKIPLPMLIHSRYYDDNTDAQRFDGDRGSDIHVREWPDRATPGDRLESSSTSGMRDGNAPSADVRRLTGLSVIARRTA